MLQGLKIVLLMLWQQNAHGGNNWEYGKNADYCGLVSFEFTRHRCKQYSQDLIDITVKAQIVSGNKISHKYLRSKLRIVRIDPWSEVKNVFVCVSSVYCNQSVMNTTSYKALTVINPTNLILNITVGMRNCARYSKGFLLNCTTEAGAHSTSWREVETLIFAISKRRLICAFTVNQTDVWTTVWLITYCVSTLSLQNDFHAFSTRELKRNALRFAHLKQSKLQNVLVLWAESCNNQTLT